MDIQVMMLSSRFVTAPDYLINNAKQRRLLENAAAQKTLTINNSGRRSADVRC